MNQLVQASASLPPTIRPGPQALNRTNSAASVSRTASHDAAYWIGLAEQKCVPSFSYKVIVSTQTITNAGASAVPDQKPVSMTYSPDRGLRLDATTGNASFSVDVASVLRKMSGKTPWTIEREESLDAEPTVCVSSSNERLSVKVWIRLDDGAVLQFEQSIEGKQIASCKLVYTSVNGTLVPEKVTTVFPATGRTMIQDYRSYVVN